jgi:hypothetical protein
MNLSKEEKAMIRRALRFYTNGDLILRNFELKMIKNLLARLERVS